MRVPLAVNNDTLATWLLPVLAPVLAEEQLLVEFVLDDQSHTFTLLEQDRTLACISGEPEPMRGCTITPLHLDVPLYWHAWGIQPPRLERMGAALVKGAREVLLPGPLPQ